jgi:preprotein translocase subunit YajC
MGSTIFHSMVLLAQGAPAGGAAGGSGGLWQLAITFLPILVLFYLLMLRPQRQEQAKRAKMLEALKKNDRVVTIGGMYGVVTNVHREADEVTLKVDEATNTKVRVQLSAITRVLGQEEPSSPASSTK